MESEKDVHRAFQNGMLFYQKKGMIRLTYKHAEKVVKYVEDESNQYWSKGDLLACKDDIPVNAETDEFYHATPAENAQRIINEDGLMPSVSEDCSNGHGVYVTDSLEEAKEWAEVLGSEEGFEHYVILGVYVPSCMPVTKDTRPINPSAVPASNVVCTEIGIPERFIFAAEDYDVDTENPTYGGYPN